jgi:hypothetical protein
MMSNQSNESTEPMSLVHESRRHDQKEKYRTSQAP